MNIELYIASIDEDFSSRVLEDVMTEFESKMIEPSSFVTTKFDNHLDWENWENWGNWGNWGNWDNWTNWTNWSNFSTIQNSRPQDISQLSCCVRLRSESFGGLAYNPINKKVFRIDEKAYRTLKLLLEGSSVEHAAAKIGVQKSEIESLIQFIYGQKE